MVNQDRKGPDHARIDGFRSVVQANHIASLMIGLTSDRQWPETLSDQKLLPGDDTI